MNLILKTLKIKSIVRLLGRCALVCIAICASIFYFKTANSSYLRIPIRIFPLNTLVMSDIEIEGKKYCVDIDLGLSVDLSLASSVQNKLKIKKNSKQTILNSPVGTSHATVECKIPALYLKTWKIPNITLLEENHSYLLNSLFWTSEQEKQKILEDESQFKQGTIGWPIFSRFCCYFDIPHREIIIGKTMDALKLAGCSLEGFIQIPFTLDRIGLILTAVTDFGIQRFFLDTGASHSIIDETLIDHQNRCEIGPDIWVCSTHSLVFNKSDLGTWEFRLFPISNFHQQFNGVLGTDFFKAHAICFDFHQRIAYIQP